VRRGRRFSQDLHDSFITDGWLAFVRHCSEVFTLRPRRLCSIGSIGLNFQAQRSASDCGVTAPASAYCRSPPFSVRLEPIKVCSWDWRGRIPAQSAFRSRLFDSGEQRHVAPGHVRFIRSCRPRLGRVRAAVSHAEARQVPVPGAAGVERQQLLVRHQLLAGPCWIESPPSREEGIVSISS